MGQQVQVCEGRLAELTSTAEIAGSVTVFAISFMPDKPVENFPELPPSILSYGQRMTPTRRGRMNRRARSEELRSVPDTEGEYRD